jgi:glycosyltransferase involved in cell wall biosynthesis
VTRADLDIPASAFVVCLASRAVVEKGWREAVEVTGRARRLTERDLRLVLVGDGPEHERLQREGVPEYVHLLGCRANVIDYYAVADIGLLPSRFKGESFPLSVLECLGAGTPMVATDVGEVRSMLANDEGDLAGEVFSLHGDEIPVEVVARIIASFVTDPAVLGAARGRAVPAAARFGMERVVEAYGKVYEACLASGRGAR